MSGASARTTPARAGPVTYTSRRDAFKLVLAGTAAGAVAAPFSDPGSVQCIGGFFGLRVGMYAAGTGEVTLRNFTYRGIKED